ncbi:MAG: FMN-dependent NADH-azoreductase [Caulobacteraceae bacterium]|nr:FMN-dependent NADH-azoreductase [Caulobacteraceae bacterium]
MTVLHIDSSILGDNAVSRELSAEVARREAARTGGEIVRRDLGAKPLPHLSGDDFLGRGAAPGERTPEQSRDAAVLDEFLAADVVVIGAPMYNFSIPSNLKAWIDRVAVAGKTFAYTEAGPVGLATGKKAVVISTRGGLYSEGPAAGMDHQESYLKTVLGFLGVTDVEFVRAERLSFGPEVRAQSVADARAEIDREARLAA